MLKNENIINRQKLNKSKYSCMWNIAKKSPEGIGALTNVYKKLFEGNSFSVFCNGYNFDNNPYKNNQKRNNQPEKE